MPTHIGTVQIESDGAVKKFIVKDTPDMTFTNPPAWVWELVVGNAGAAVTVDYTAGPPIVFNKVTVG